MTVKSDVTQLETWYQFQSCVQFMKELTKMVHFTKW